MQVNKEAVHKEFARLYNFLNQLLPGLSEDTWRLIEQAFEPHTYSRNEIILHQGDTCDHVWFINRGIVAKYCIVGGKQHVNDLIAETAFFSDLNGFLFRVPSQVSVRALEETETLRIGYTDVQHILNKAPETGRLGLLIAEKMLVAQSQRISQLTVLSPEKRYREFVTAQAEMLSRVPLYLIASYLSLTPESLSRIRARFKKKAIKKDLS